MQNNFFENNLRTSQSRTAPEKKLPALTPLEFVEEWWNNQPNDIKQQPYLTMQFFMRDFETSPGCMGKILYQLGFRKSRICPNDGPHQRVWIPPGYNTKTVNM